MFNKKYTITIIDSQWQPIKNNIKFSFLPRRDEFIFFNDMYYQVLNIVHTHDKKHNIFIVVTKTNKNNDSLITDIQSLGE